MTATRTKRFRRDRPLKRYEKHRRRNCFALPGIHDVIIVLDHLKAGFNVPKIFRSAQAFGAREVHLIDIGPFDPTPAKGAFKAVPARFYSDFAESYRDLRARDYTLFTLEPCADTRLFDAELPPCSAFVFGHEEVGLSFSNDDYPDIVRLSIPQWGSMDSLNVSVAASIVMYEYVRRHGRPVASDGGRD